MLRLNDAVALYGDNMPNKRCRTKVLFNTLGIGNTWSAAATWDLQCRWGVQF
jgi:hypothetical protein